MGASHFAARSAARALSGMSRTWQHGSCGESGETAGFMDANVQVGSICRNPADGSRRRPGRCCHLPDRGGAGVEARHDSARAPAPSPARPASGVWRRSPPPSPRLAGDSALGRRLLLAATTEARCRMSLWYSDRVPLVAGEWAA
eukprot:3440664-Alexandrium_andersonii.AAC.2